MAFGEPTDRSRGQQSELCPEFCEGRIYHHDTRNAAPNERNLQASDGGEHCHSEAHRPTHGEKDGDAQPTPLAIAAKP